MCFQGKYSFILIFYFQREFLTFSKGHLLDFLFQECTAIVVSISN